MRITGTNSIELTQSSNRTSESSISTVKKDVQQQGSSTTSVTKANTNKELTPKNDISEESKQKVQEAVTKMNEMLDVNNSASKFMYHEGLDRYYVSVVDRETEEIVKEIPPRKLLDAFYEMQKMLGMIVDEKI
jgi:flagellar protein FlaG